MSRSTKDDGADRLLTRGESLETPELETESGFYYAVSDLFSQRYTALQGERIAAVKTAARRAYETLRYAEGIVTLTLPNAAECSQLTASAAPA